MRTYGKLRTYPYYLEHGGFESVPNFSEIAPERPKTAQHRPRTLEDSPGTPQETPGTLPRAPGTFTYVRTISFVGRELARRVLALESTYMVQGLSHFYYSPPHATLGFGLSSPAFPPARPLARPAMKKRHPRLLPPVAGTGGL